MKFKTQRIADEYDSNQVSNDLRRLVRLAEAYLLAKYNYEITITDLIRTQEEQDEIYKNNKNYLRRPWTSVHQVGRGCDIRTRDMSPQMIKDLHELLNQIQYDPTRPEKKTCTYHDVGSGIHFHIQSLN